MTAGEHPLLDHETLALDAELCIETELREQLAHLTEALAREREETTVWKAKEREARTSMHTWRMQYQALAKQTKHPQPRKGNRQVTPVTPTIK